MRYNNKIMSCRQKYNGGLGLHYHNLSGHKFLENHPLKSHIKPQTFLEITKAHIQCILHHAKLESLLGQDKN